MNLDKITITEEEKHLFADIDSSLFDEDAPIGPTIADDDHHLPETSETSSRRSNYIGSHEPSDPIKANAYFIDRYQEKEGLSDGWGAD